MEFNSTGGDPRHNGTQTSIVTTLKSLLRFGCQAAFAGRGLGETFPASEHLHQKPIMISQADRAA